MQSVDDFLVRVHGFEKIHHCIARTSIRPVQRGSRTGQLFGGSKTVIEDVLDNRARVRTGCVVQDCVSFDINAVDVYAF